MACPKCAADPQPPDFNDPRRCAFTDAGDFTPDNWNCASLEALQRYEVVIEGVDESMDVVPAVPDDYGGWLVLTRYKHRGCVSSAVHVGDFWPPRPLTLTAVLVALGELSVESEDDQ